MAQFNVSANRAKIDVVNEADSGSANICFVFYFHDKIAKAPALEIRLGFDRVKVFSSNFLLKVKKKIDDVRESYECQNKKEFRELLAVKVFKNFQFWPR